MINQELPIAALGRVDDAESIFGKYKTEMYGHPNAHGEKMMEELMLNEKAAHGIEDGFWDYYKNNQSARLEIFK